MKDRVSWKTYFMNIAKEVATRSTCDRKHVGAVIVRDKTILSTGYNGSIKGLKHCDEIGHEMIDGHCVRSQLIRWRNCWAHEVIPSSSSLQRSCF